MTTPLKWPCSYGELKAWLDREVFEGRPPDQFIEPSFFVDNEKKPRPRRKPTLKLKAALQDYEKARVRSGLLTPTGRLRRGSRKLLARAIAERYNLLLDPFLKIIDDKSRAPR